jgi:hypothetical protein
MAVPVARTPVAVVAVVHGLLMRVARVVRVW